ncbi:MAG: D-glycero-beta-D-manno-heptose 1-phosphate adenylyltransferase [Xanthomonadaceae bacterium]|nr:D-glycero-beta-D-manno-heptose 1-phosphate adenylyltransferase [Xanthomonadaceae bacterium]
MKSKVLSPEKLKSVLAKLRSKKKKIVFTNGCFDILHVGHVTYLQQAKDCGDVLVVALNSDGSVRKLKGSTRPVNTLKDRIAVISALESVDYVTFFSDETPKKLIETLSPNVLVKGGDWNPAQIVGSEHVLKQGGRVKSLPFVKGKSTSNLIQKIIETT